MIRPETDSDDAADRRRRAAAIEQMRQMVAEGRIELDLVDETRHPRRTG
jgi:hypothetical protein